MPIYEYECKACGHRLEALQKMSDEPLRECPACHEQQLHKLMSATGGFQFKSKTQNSCPAASSCGSGSCPAASR